MADVQIAVIGGESSQVVASTVGIQGPAGISSYATVSGTSYMLSNVDRSKILIFTASGATTVTVPSGLSTLFDTMIVQSGLGQVTVSGASGVTINAALSATKTAYRYAVATLLPIGTNAFILSGEVTA